MSHRSKPPGTVPAIAPVNAPVNAPAADQDATWDAVVVGGGPAGSVAAISLAGEGRRVLLVERRARQRFKLGESIPPAVRPFVERLLGEDAADDDLIGRPTHGNVSCWGSDEPAEQSFVFSPYGHGLRLDRARFDRALRRRAEEAGATVREGVGVSRIEGESPWELEIGDEVHGARFLLDCSGRNALVARHCGAWRQTSDRLFAFARVFEAPRDADTLTRIEATPRGWWYTARLPGRSDDAAADAKIVQRIVVFHTDRDLPSARRAATAEGFDELLAESRHVGPLLRRHGYASPDATVRGAPAGGERLDRFAGPGWIAAGDAAQAFDPLSSQGIGKALSSGLAAGSAVHRALVRAPDGTRHRAQDDPLARYDAEQESIHAEYLRQHRRFYAAEGRWPRERFWSRRRREPSVATSRQTRSPGAGEDARAPRLRPSPSSSSTPPLPTRPSKESPCVP